MLGHALDGRRLLHPVLHPLRGLLHRIPLHAADARHMALVHASEHVLQRVAALVEEGANLADGHQARRDRAVRVAHGRALVAHNLRRWEAHRLARRGAEPGPGAHLGHPRAPTLLPRPRVGVHEAVGHGLLPAAELEEAHLRVPHLRADRRGLHRVGGDAKQRLHLAPEAVKDRVQGQVGAHHLVVEGVPLLLELLRVVGHVPVPQGPPGEFLELGVLRGRAVKALGAEVLQEALGALEARHLLREGHVGVGRVAQELGALRPEGEDAVDDRLVVHCLLTARGRRGGRGRRAGHVRAVHGLAEVRVVRVAEHGDEGGRVESHHPGALLGAGLGVAARTRRSGHHLERALGEAPHLVRAGELAGKGLGGVQNVVGEGGGEARELRLDLPEALLVVPGEADALELRPEHLQVGHAPLLGRELRPDGLVRFDGLPAAVHGG
mmetsp:Transcript_24700/g.82847  ORF Transcript_24700/g.82847 Transcript_24700/m.82847 type:complete len:438 (+) Transcript_24700:767-2080(+)